MADSLLIIEDEPLFGAELQRQFANDGWHVTLAANLAEAGHFLTSDKLDPLLILADMNLPDGNSLDFLETMRARGTASEWIFLTGYGTVPDSVRALKLGAYDFLVKPCEPERLSLITSAAARSARAQRQVHEEASAQQEQYTPNAFLGSSTAAEEVRSLIRRLLPVPITALILSGETGSGKGLVARILHYSGRRRAGRMIEINCAALPRDLLESELFGHEAGAFTGARGRRRGRLEQADGGTLFLDEISDMDIDLQAKLLRVIEDQRFWRIGGDIEIQTDFQIIAASNRDLAANVAEGTFRADLYHRLNVLSVDLPALRDRISDLDDLLPHLLATYSLKFGRNVRRVSDDALSQMRAYNWPGNVRELRNVVERCVLLATDETLPVQWLRLNPDKTETAGESHSEPLDALPTDGSMSLAAIERQVIKSVLEKNKFNISRTARVLDISRETLRYRLQKHGLTRSAR